MRRVFTGLRCLEKEEGRLGDEEGKYLDGRAR